MTEDDQEPVRCPVCGSPPSSVDYVEIGNGRFLERVPFIYHCPNETRDDHLEGT